MAKKNYLDRGVDSAGIDDNATAKNKNYNVYDPNYITMNDVAKPQYLTNSMAYPTYSPSAAQYSYGKAAPTWQWDDSARPGEWQWDDSARPEAFSYKDAPTYTNQYQEQINQMVDNILNRPAFSYDYNADPLYQMYKEAYTRNGAQAMKDTLGQVSARTGGLASSYAGTASQQAYNQYMDALNDKVPELYQLAYSMYNNEGNIMRNNLSMVQGLENTDYGRYMDQLGQYNTDRNLAYSQWQAAMDQYNTDRNFSYGQYGDLWDRYYNDRNFSYGQYQDALGQWNTDRSWDYNIWSDNLSRQEAARQAAYQQQVAAYNARQKEIDAYNDNQTALYQAALQAENDRVNTHNQNELNKYNASLSRLKDESGNGGSSSSGTSSSKKTYPEDADQYDYGVWKTSNGYEFMGRNYTSPAALENAIKNANLSDDMYENTLKTMLNSGIISQAEYKELLLGR